MIVRYRVEVDVWGRRVGIPDESGEFVLFVPDHVRCEVVRHGVKGSAVCTDRSEIYRYTATEYKVYMWDGRGWVKVGYANSWITAVDVLYVWRPSIWVAAGRSVHKLSGAYARFLEIAERERERCRESGCVSDFYDVYKPKRGDLLAAIDWAITKKGWREFGVV